jgi:hypothetical protein
MQGEAVTLNNPLCIVYTNAISGKFIPAHMVKTTHQQIMKVKIA